MGLYEGQNVFTRAFKAGGDILRGTFVSLNSSGQVVTATAGGPAIGVALEDYTSGPNAPYVWPPRKAVSVRLLGSAMVEAGAAITPGQQVEVGADGKAVPLGTGKPVGVALTGGAAGSFIEVLLK